MNRLALTALAACGLAAPALAHATLETPTAQVNATYKAEIRIAHGCGDEPTLKLVVDIPPGVIAVRPMPKAGWTLETTVAPYDKTYDYHGPVSEGVKQIVWTGELKSDHYDVFTFLARITDDHAGTEVLYFPTTQVCANGENAWVQIPEPGTDPHSLPNPAPGLKLLAPAHEHVH